MGGANGPLLISKRLLIFPIDVLKNANYVDLALTGKAQHNLTQLCTQPTEPNFAPNFAPNQPNLNPAPKLCAQPKDIGHD